MSGSADDSPAKQAQEARAGDAARRDAIAGLTLDKGGSFTPRRRGRLPPALVWLVVLAALAAGFWLFRMATAVPVVRTGSVQRSSPIAERELTTANGYVRARTRASLASKTQGRLVEVRVDEGDTVEAGQLLAVVDHDEVDAALLWVAARIDAQRCEVSRADALIDESTAAQTSAVALIAERSAARASLAQNRASPSASPSPSSPRLWSSPSSSASSAAPSPPAAPPASPRAPPSAHSEGLRIDPVDS